MMKQASKHLALSLACLGLVLSTSPSLAQSIFIRPHARPGQGGAQRAGELAGSSSPEQPNIPGTPTVVNFGTIDFPGASDSAAFRVNDRGQIVGGYGPSQVLVAGTGFLLTKNSFRSINFPGAAQTESTGINNAGEIVGVYVDHAGNLHGFSLKETYTSIDFPGAVGVTGAFGVNDSGEIVGEYIGSNNVEHGFTLVGGTYTSFDFPGATLTSLNGINNSGEIVGEYIDAAGNYHGLSLVGGVFTTIDYPGAVFSALLSINDKGVMVGAYGDGVNNLFGGFEHGFTFSGGQYLNVDVPFVGAGSTSVNGINNFGQIAGDYTDTAGRVYGFTAKFVP